MVYSKILSLINGVSRTVDFSVSGNTFGSSAIELIGSSSGSVTVNASATGSVYSLKLPSAQGSASSVLQNDGSGNLSWGTITTVSTISNTFTAGESFAANTSYVVRWAIESLGETVDEVRKADYDTTSNDEFWALGFAFSPTAVSVGQSITVYSFGAYSLGSGDTPFSSASIGDPVWLTSAGGFSVTPPSGSSQADFKVGIVMTTTQIWIDGQSMGIGGGGGPAELPFTVVEGGTGVAAFNPYGVIVGGTTSTGALQQVGGLGTSGYVLTSNGPSALPSWQAGGSALVFADSLVNTSGTVTLVNDSASPGNTKYYGTNGSGTLGYYSIPATGVSSVAFADASTTPIYTISGSPVTSSGTLTQTLTTQSINTVFAGPSSGSAAQPTFRSLVAADVPTLNQNTTGTASNITATSNSTLTTLSALSLPGSQVTGNISGNAANITATSNSTLTTLSALSLPTTQLSGTLQAAQEPAHTGDVTNTAGSLALSLVATSNSTLTTLSALTTASSLASIGTITSGTWHGSTIGYSYGGTNATSQSAAQINMSPMTTAGDLTYENSTPAPARLAIGTTGQVLTVVSGLPAWSSPATSGTVTSVAFADASTTPIYSITGSPVTSSGTLTQTLTTQTANTVFAGPSSGSAAQPSFRALVSADIPSLSAIYLPLAGGTMSGAINMGSHQINALSTPTLSTDAATKGYVDAAISGLYWQGPAKAYAASNVPLTGAGTLTIDGYSVQNGDLVILGNQTTASQNGEYSASGIGTAYVLTSNGLPSAAGDAWLILNGTIYKDSAFVANSAFPSATFTEFAGPTAYTFTAPLSLTGSTVSITQATTSTNGYLSSADWNTFNNKQAAGNYITALTGDITASGPGSAAATLATVNSNVGTFASVTVNGKGLVTAASALSGDATTSGSVITLATVATAGTTGSSTSIPSVTINAKGLVTSVTGNAVIAPAGTLSGTTLNSTVVSSSLTSVGTIATGVWNGTAIGPTYGGTGIVTYSTGDTLYGSATNVLSKLSIGSTGQVLTVSGGVPTWATPATNGTVTSVSVVSANGLAGTVATSTTTPAITLSTTITGILQGNGTAISAASTTGSGAVVLATSPTLVTPALGTPSALVGTNITGTASGLTAGTVTTNAAMTGDVTSTGSSNVTTLATVNSNVGTFGSSTAIPVVTVNGKGLVTAISTAAVIAPAGTLSGTTLNSTVVSSSLTSVGTITSGTWTGTTIAVANGGTGTTTSTGTGSVVLSNSPSLTTPALGTPSAAVLTNATGLPLTTGVTGTLPVANGGTGSATALVQGGVKYAASTTAEATTAAGTSGQALLSGGTGAPAFGNLAIAAGGTGGTTQATALSALGIRSGSQAISTSSTSQAVTFSSTLGSTSYSVTCTILNTTDSNPMYQPVTVTALSATGFTASWNGPTETANYVLHYQAIINV